MTLQAIEPHRLYRQIADRIAASIASGQFPPGSRLPPERDLAVQLRVSRTSVREALIALELAGLIDIRMGSGIYVRSAAPSRVHVPRLRIGARQRPHSGESGEENEDTGPFEQLRARWLIEGETASLAAKNASDDDVRVLRELNRKLAAGQMQDRIAPDRAFHVRIAEASGNSVLALVVDFLWQLREGPLFAQMERHFQTPQLWRQTIDDHTAIVAAIGARDATAARRAMRAHLTRVMREFARTLQPPRGR